LQVLPEVMITRPEELGPCCEELARCSVLGFDTEFVGEDSFHPHVCLVQAATAERLYLIDPLSAGPLDAFWKLIVDPARVVVVHAGREEVRLCRLWTGFPPGNLFDLQLAAGLAGLSYPLSHGALVQQVLGVTLTKGETLTEWRHRPLTAAQVRYAYDDVRHLLAIHEKIAGRLERLGRTEWAREEFRRLETSTDPEEAFGMERWRKLRGLGSLDRRRLAVVRALYHWREEQAERHNRPSRVILRDDLILEIARRNPTRERDLQVVRGLARRDLDSILEVVVRASELPLEQCPVLTEREQDPPQVGLAVSVLNAVLGDFCIRQDLASNLVATTQDIKLLVRSRLLGAALPAESQLTRGWRAEHVLPELLAVLDGKRSLRIADVRREAPLGFSEAMEEQNPGAP
jgi:ribonuclease D